ncbi:hypothetical protein BX616_002651 [Lobosporangium transversale]|uniref:Uncharacterized protein n=1 Tax=Lobosporangium transversale TaxID=64571 RepID=A0A1Y2G9A9_9FUNG|nr:hypothetical protein BCR41DRAFT_400969 [Lobosporangium transversale]KAF9900236.1 hypothetical protein BX616_002651 [Lobosporangium transversale]ORZ04714.1 hypothetical protein BCR41DRAFT_400969 [Lobosporangium transversale]|eukprot:XP_021876711.1 hypothetical protein BCR41DRAFT_400969 [Lobosporangium transversale]
MPTMDSTPALVAALMHPPPTASSSTPRPIILEDNFLASVIPRSIFHLKFLLFPAHLKRLSSSSTRLVKYMAFKRKRDDHDESAVESEGHKGKRRASSKDSDITDDSTTNNEDEAEDRLRFIRMQSLEESMKQRLILRRSFLRPRGMARDWMILGLFT